MQSATTSRIGIFNPKEDKPKHLLDLPPELAEMIASYLPSKNLIALMQVSKANRQKYYPSLKTALVKVLKELVAQDDTVRVAKLLAVFPNTPLRTDAGDPLGLAYQEIETTPYQDTLADVMQEEMRTLLEKSFPSLRHAALQAQEFEQPCFEHLREEKRKIMEERTTFAYETFKRRHTAWAAIGYDRAQIQPVRDACIRVELAKDHWSPRLRKIFSAVAMDENQTFENLARDLPEPHFLCVRTDPWLLRTAKGCDFRLMNAPQNQDLSAEDFRDQLRTTSDGYPVLIRQGEEEEKEAAYHLYAPYIPLDRDESEWKVVPIDDPAVIELIQRGKQPPYSETTAAVDFNQPSLPYHSAFNDLYRFGSERSLYVGSGGSYIFTVHNDRFGMNGERAWLVKGSMGCGRGSVWRPDSSKNFAAVTALYKKRAERLASHLVELRDYLPVEPQADARLAAP